VLESADPSSGDYTNLLTVRVVPGEGGSGTTIGRDDRAWLVGVGNYQVEIELEPHMLVMLNDDRPGMIGAVGTLLGSEGVNIANMNVSRNARGEAAVMVLTVDTTPGLSTLELLRREPGIRSVRSVTVA
jgi:D-3-phosphoglycerate dehydrogenase